MLIIVEISIAEILRQMVPEIGAPRLLLPLNMHIITPCPLSIRSKQAIQLLEQGSFCIKPAELLPGMID